MKLVRKQARKSLFPQHKLISWPLAVSYWDTLRHIHQNTLYSFIFHTSSFSRCFNTVLWSKERSRITTGRFPVSQEGEGRPIRYCTACATSLLHFNFSHKIKNESLASRKTKNTRETPDFSRRWNALVWIFTCYNELGFRPFTAPLQNSTFCWL